MSADNWASCPACKKKQDNELIILQKEIEETYGRIPRDGWEKLKESNEKKMKLCLDQTLREDYEIGMFEEGEFYVSYSASCSVCNFEFSFKHSEEIKNV